MALGATHNGSTAIDSNYDIVIMIRNRPFSCTSWRSVCTYVILCCYSGILFLEFAALMNLD